ncbi:MAG: S8 family serine peptidase [Proteobacteria bacterium]|nr:S8 family serine peptidase [Pseudomonadota bacterium]
MFALCVVAACGGGGGGGGSASAFNTTEFQTNYGLARISALKAYDNGGTGSGVTVGIIDSGIDLNNTEFTGRIAAASIDIRDNSSAQDTDGHGTQIAGIIGAARNNVGIHGVAFSSTILAIQVADSTTLAFDDAATAINTARTNGATVLNLSFGNAAGVSTAFQNALQAAVNAGIVVAVAAGNSSTAQAEFPARFANCTGQALVCNGFNAQGNMIAVGATDTNNNLATFSARAGDTASAFLVAPGVSVVTTALGGGTTTVSGTSFSAPHVAGALAVIRQKFPTLTASQAVTLLLSTATDLGNSGTDMVFGRGLLNLGGAFTAQGLAVLPTGTKIGDSSVPLGGSTVKLGAAFGNALQTNALLGKSIVLDSYGRPFSTDLGSAVLGGTIDTGITGFVRAPEGRNRTVATGGTGTLSLSMVPAVQSRSDLLTFGNVRPDPATERVDSAFFSGSIGAATDFSLALNASSVRLFDDIANFAGDASPFQGLEFASAPQLTLVGRGDGGGGSYFVDPRTRITLGFMESAADPLTGAPGNSLMQAALTHGLAFGPVVRVGIGRTHETATLFNTSASGAFGAVGDTDGTFLNIGASIPIRAGLAAHVSYTDVSAEALYSGDGYLKNWSTVRASAFSAGLTRKGLFRKEDNAGIAIYQPLRVYGAQADLTIPVGTEPVPGGAIHYQTERVDVTPSGREIDLQLAYRWQPTDILNAATYGVIMLNPGHDNTAKTALGAGLRLWLDF